MDDDAYARSADAMQQRLQQSTDRQSELAAIFGESDLVFGLYPDPESITRWDKYLIKGRSDLMSDNSATISCLWCRSIEEAMTWTRMFANAVPHQTK